MITKFNTDEFNDNRDREDLVLHGLLNKGLFPIRFRNCGCEVLINMRNRYWGDVSKHADCLNGEHIISSQKDNDEVD